MLLGLASCDFYYHDPVYDSRDRIIGRYEMEEFSETFNDHTHYDIWIDRSGSYDGIWIDNFYGVNIRVRATYSYDKIIIKRQIVNGYEVEGVGTVYGSRIAFSYRVKDLYKTYPTDFLDGTAYKDY